MNQDQNVDNDLQKAIDDITKTTSVDPVFSEPVAAPSTIPEGDTGAIEPVGPFPEPVPEAPIADIPTPDVPTISDPTMDYSVPAPEAPEAPEAPAEEPEETKEPISEMPDSLTTAEIKKAALRDLLPLLDKITLNEEQKFNIYRDVFEELNDYTVLDEAYEAAKSIADETKRAESLLYLVEAIDKM